jgi:hypothetical protein
MQLAVTERRGLYRGLVRGVNFAREAGDLVNEATGIATGIATGSPATSRGFGTGRRSAAPQNRKFNGVAILSLWLKQHTSLKNPKLDVASIDSKPSPDSI